MLIFFATRSKARTFAKGQKKVIDKGQASSKRSESPQGEQVAQRRWGVKIA